MSDTIILNGLVWDKENLSVDGNIYFTYQEAIKEASKLGKRLPTKDEFEALLQLHHIFDRKNKGMWFAENQADLKSEKSLFLPASGFTRVSYLSFIDNIGRNGFYWSETLYKHNEAYRLGLSNINSASVCMYYKDYSYTVRCVSDLK